MTGCRCVVVVLIVDGILETVGHRPCRDVDHDSRSR